MIPILYEKNETAFVSNGLGRLRDCISCIVTEERNGIYECDFEYPITGANYDLIQLGRIVGVTHDDTGDVQPFDIVSYSRPINGVVTFHAVHVSYRQSYLTVTGTNINSLADAFTLLGTAEPNNPFTYQTDKTSMGYMAAADGTPRTVRSLLGGVEGSILDAYGGEYKFDKFLVSLLSSRGQARDFSIRYGVNMLDYNEDGDASGTYSSVIPYWTDGTNTVVGDRQDGFASTVTGRGECVPLDVSNEFDNANGPPTKEQVEAAGLAKLNGTNTALPTSSIKVSFVRLQDMSEYETYNALLQCQLCDTVNVIFPGYNSSGSFKIVKTVWNVLKDRFDEMELGTLSTTLAEALGITNGLGGGGSTTPIESDTYNGSYNIQVKMYKIGRIVILNLHQTSATALEKGGWSALGTLPSKYRPLVQTDVLVADNSATNAGIMALQIRINTNGTFNAYAFPQNAPNNEIMGTIAYVSAS